MDSNSMNKPLIDEQTGQILQDYAKLQASQGAQKLQEALKRQSQVGEGSDILGLGSSTAFMAAKGLIESKPIQTGLGYAKTYVSDIDKGGFDYATNNLKMTLKNKLQDAVAQKKAEIQGKLQDKVDSVKQDVTDRVNQAQEDIEGQLNDGIDKVNNTLADAQTTVENAVNNGVNTVNDAVTTANNAVNDGITTANDAVNNGVNVAENTVENMGSRLTTSDINLTNALQQGIPRSMDGLQANAEGAFTQGTQIAENTLSNISQSARNLGNAGEGLYNGLMGNTGSELGQNSFDTFFGNLFGSNSSGLKKTDPLDSEFGTDSLMQTTTTDPVVSSGASGVAEGAEAGAGALGEDAGLGLTELVGASLDATGVLAPLGVVVSLAGLGYSLYSGLKDMFSSSDDNPAPNPDANEGEIEQLGS